MRHFITVLIFLALPLFLTCSQKKQIINLSCGELKRIISSPIFNERFYFSDYPDEEFIIVDTSRLFAECYDLDSIRGRKITIIDTLPPKAKMIKNVNYIMVTVGRKQCVLSIGFLSPARGSLLVIHYLTEGENLDLLGYKIGDL